MGDVAKWTKKLLKWLALSILAVAVAAMFRPIVWMVAATCWWTMGFSGPPFGVPFPGACVSETLSETSTPAGLDFKFIYTNCDLLAKQESLSISISQGTGLLGWFGEREVIKYFGPEVLPTVTVIDPHTVLISITSVESIIFARDRWRDIAIRYDIGHINYSGKRDPPRK